MTTKLETFENADIAIPLAASVAERAAELVADGHVKGLLSSGYKGVKHFCANGAISLALQEVFGDCDVNHINGLQRERCETGEQVGAKSVYDLLVAFAKQEAEIRFGYVPTELESNISHFNDRQETSQDAVVTVLRGAAQRLWNISLEADAPEPVRSWAEDEAEPATQHVTTS